jgi:large subunit ribosomal protein L4
MIAAALLGVLSDRARGERIHVVESFGVDAPSTRAAVDVLGALGATKNVLVVLDRADENGALSVRNLEFVHVLYADQLNAYDVVVSDDIVFTKAAFDAFVSSKASAGSTTGSDEEAAQ